jgi:hypothetical protein
MQKFNNSARDKIWTRISTKTPYARKFSSKYTRDERCPNEYMVDASVIGDARDEKSYTQALKGQKADLILTDPPYCILSPRRVRGPFSRQRKMDHEAVVNTRKLHIPSCFTFAFSYSYMIKPTCVTLVVTVVSHRLAWSRTGLFLLSPPYPQRSDINPFPFSTCPQGSDINPLP